MPFYFIDLFRPWKLISFLLSTGLLCYGACNLDFPDWNIPVSLIMASLTYLTAPFVINTFILSIKSQNKHPLLYFLFALAIAFFVIDLSYVIYNQIFHHIYFRKENFIVSSCLYFMCGLVWRYNDNLKSLPIFKKTI
jgi:hypothetical protein